jgi:putative two-component system response regulator
MMDFLHPFRLRRLPLRLRRALSREPDRMQRRAQAKAAEQRRCDIKTTLDFVRDGVFIFEPEMLRFTYVNQGAVAQVGYSDRLLHAALMHDIGKIGIADSVLLKPGKLTPDEFAIMQRHTSIGADILAGGKSEVLRLAATVALTHHEKWDGSGYPKGLAGEQIPLVGRIVAICDVFDALTSARPYKTAWSEEDALEFIRQQAGKHFDPELVLAFLRIMPEIRALRERFSDD